LTFSVLLHPEAARFLQRTDISIRHRLKEQLAELRESPEKRGERLKGSPFWRLRIGDYRAIYEIDRNRNLVIVLFVGHRSGVYDDFSKLP
jgi:mRNA interferase RelE/StbE